MPGEHLRPLLRRQRLRYSEHPWPGDSPLHLAGTGLYEDTILPTGSSTGTAEETLDCACELYLMTPDF